MKKSNLSITALILSVLLLVPLLSSCDFLQNIFHVHTYKYFYDGESHWRVCSECGEKTADEAHGFSLRETVDATCDHVGYVTSECSLCGYVKTDFLQKAAHEFRVVDESGARECVNCHRKESALTELPETERYGYLYLSSLDDGEKYLNAYEKISAAIAARSDSAVIYETLTSVETSMVYHCVVADHPEYFWIGGEYSYSHADNEIREFTLSYNMSAEELPDAKERFNNALDEILSGVSTEMTDFEKELYLHDAIVKSNTYDDTYEAPMNHSAYGALVLKRSVCDGYSKLFSCLLTQCGILSSTISGYCNENHSWNIVKIDGEWYMVDPTWDDPLGNEPGDASHVYFNCSWKRFSAEHSFMRPNGEIVENYFAIPECTSERYDYFTYFGYECRLENKAVDKLVNEYVDRGERRIFEFRITNLPDAAEEKKAAVGNFVNKDFMLVATLANALGIPMSKVDFSYGVSTDMNVFRITMK